MSNESHPKWTSTGAGALCIGVIILLTVVVIWLGFTVYHLHKNMALIDEKGRRLRAWAVESAQWSTHVTENHLKDEHLQSALAPSHIPPPDDPPPRWD